MIITILIGVLYMRPNIPVFQNTPENVAQVLSANDTVPATPSPIELTIFPTIVELPIETPTSVPTPLILPTIKPTTKPTPFPSIVPTASPTVTQATPTTTTTPTPTILITPTIVVTPTTTLPTPTIIKTSSEEINRQIDSLGAKYKVDPNIIRHIAICESGFNPMAENYIYAGLFQFSPSTWSSYRSQMHLDQNPTLRYSSFDAIETAAYALSLGDSRIWPNCYPK